MLVPTDVERRREGHVKLIAALQKFQAAPANLATVAVTELPLHLTKESSTQRESERTSVFKIRFGQRAMCFLDLLGTPHMHLT